MKGSLIVLTLFVAGIAIGISGILPEASISANLTEWLLYALVLQIGLSLGAGGNLRRVVSELSPRALLLPLATVVGTLAMTAIVGMAIGGWSLTDYLAIGSGMGYYSLSSVLIIDIKTPTLGSQAATSLGMTALLVNIIREMTALILGPWLRRLFGRYAPTAAAGVTSMDVTLPMILRTCGDRMLPTALMHGMLLEITVPLLVTLFASL